MRFGIFYEHQYPRPWPEGGEQKLFQDALQQVELADRLGIDHAWEVEHHFLEEYSHSSAPEVFLAAASQRTQQIRLGHGIVLLPPNYNPPARVAERIATLDLVSNGRVEFGTGESASRAELEGYNIDPNERRPMWREAVEQIANMLAMDPYPGYEGECFGVPAARRRAEAGAAATSAAVGGVFEPGDHPPGSAAGDRRADLRVRRPRGSEEVGRGLLRDVQARVRAGGARGEPERRDGDELLGAPGPRRGGSSRGLDGFRFFQFALGTPLRVRACTRPGGRTSGRCTRRCAKP
ncbi:MAG: LLM class flavin-dependent oxidoreductase [Dehalococcoidia bacterium]|nr:LLM class flavin-dependent oxidoreductase [Dehalococcoidia bacterium]